MRSHSRSSNRNWKKRLRLVQKIDCTDPNPAPDTFLDHTGRISKPALNVGKVVTRNGMTYRETGRGLLDYFCYKLDLPSTGEAMIAELVIPDDADRYIYSAVLETIPVGMEHNTPPVGSKAWPNASGTVSTGDLYPLSNGKKKFRYVFFPGTKNTTLLVQNGRVGIPAAVCEINIYAVEGGLPALKLPKTDRTYGNHNERLIFNAWGSYRDAVAYGTEAHLVQYYDGAWLNAYRAIARKIQFLRFQGHNASVEGAYMYENGVFSSRHSRSVLNNDRFDYYYALLKLYRHNNIKTFVGFEYMRSSALDAMGAFDTTDAQVHAGRKRSVYMIDRFGRQVIGYNGMGLNCMNPVVWWSVTDLLKELYARYDGVGDVEGLVTLNGSWWLPGFPSYSNMEAAEVGYDDDSVEQFEKETGVRLNLPRTGIERFAARYELLTGKYREQWFGWRGRKIREKLLEMRQIVSSGKQKWKLFSWPAKATAERNAFNTSGIRPQVRDEYMARIQREAGFPQELYGTPPGDSKTTLISICTGATPTAAPANFTGKTMRLPSTAPDSTRTSAPMRTPRKGGGGVPTTSRSTIGNRSATSGMPIWSISSANMCRNMSSTPGTTSICRPPTGSRPAVSSRPSTAFRPVNRRSRIPSGESTPAGSAAI